MQQLTLDQTIHLGGKDFLIIGIDEYRLRSVSNEERQWISYTLLSDDNERTWISHGVAGEWFTRWAEISLDQFSSAARDASLALDLTGLTSITFEGDKGHSTPFAELTWLHTNTQEFDFLVIERFLNTTTDGIRSLEPYFQTGRVLKDVVF